MLHIWAQYYQASLGIHENHLPRTSEAYPESFVSDEKASLMREILQTSCQFMAADIRCNPQVSL